MLFFQNLTTVDYILIAIIGAFALYNFYITNHLQKLLPYSSHQASKIKVLSVVAGENIDTSSIEKALYTTDIDYNLLDYASVSRESFLAELEKEVTVAEISSHGLNGQFRLGNEILPATWLASVLENYKTLECVLLLYCNSYQDVDLIATTKVFTVGLVGEVTDTSCVLFSRQFYYYLNKRFSYKEAFERARLILPIHDFPRFVFKEGNLAKKTKFLRQFNWSKIWKIDR
jgi:hypothetical protein